MGTLTVLGLPFFSSLVHPDVVGAGTPGDALYDIWPATQQGDEAGPQSGMDRAVKRWAFTTG